MWNCGAQGQVFLFLRIAFFGGGLGAMCGAVDLPGMGRGCGSGEDVVVVVVVADGILPSRDLSRFAGILRQVEGHTHRSQGTRCDSEA